MTAPIRDMAELVEALRTAQIERNVSYETIEHASKMAGGTVAKYLAQEPSKNLGFMSAFDIAFGLGKALAVIDDPEAIALVSEHWKKRHRRGGASLQLKARAASLASVAGIEELARVELSNRMKALRSKVKKSSLSNSGKRRMKIMKKRGRQAQASHAARTRWNKEKRV